MRKLFKIFVLGMGLTTVLTFIMILLFNTPVIMGVTRFIPEGNKLIRFTEFFFGFLSLPFFGYWMWEVAGE